MAAGAGLIRRGGGSRGVAARGYPETLARRLTDLRALRDRIEFVLGDGLELLRQHANRPSAAYFIDPPYTAARGGAGRRLYSRHAVSHSALFETMAELAGCFVTSYDDVAEIRALALRHGFATRRLAMRTSHNRVRHELLVIG